MEQIIVFLLHHWILSASLLAILAALAALEFRTSIRGIKQLNPQQVTQLINREDAVVLDVRDTNLFKNGHIIGAISIPRAQLEKQVAQLNAHKNKPMIIVSDLEQASVQAGVLLQKQGFTQLHSLRGGMNAWRNAELPLSKKNK